MKKEELIKKLQELPDGIEVCLFDYNQNIYHADGDEEGNSQGIYPEFKIGMATKEEIPKDAMPWAFISFENKDYDENGNRLNNDEV